MTFHIGKFNTKINIQKATIGTDAMGGQRISWSDYADAYAFMEWKEGKSGDDNNRVSSYEQAEFTIRNIGSNLQKVSGKQSFRIIVPNETGAAVDTIRYWVIDSFKLHGDQYNRYKTFICFSEDVENVKSL